MLSTTNIVRAEQRAARKARIRRTLRGTAERPRLTVFRSHQHIYAQIIDDVAGHTIASASTMEKGIAAEVKDLKPMAQAEKIGEIVAKRAMEKSIQAIAFDRNGYKFHGRVKAVAEGARKGGLNF